METKYVLPSATFKQSYMNTILSIFYWIFQQQSPGFGTDPVAERVALMVAVISHPDFHTKTQKKLNLGVRFANVKTLLSLFWIYTFFH